MPLNRNEYMSVVDVRPDDIDLFGHVHSSKYMDYFLAARFVQMQENYGLGMPEFLSKQLGWFLKDFDISYKRQVKLGDKVRVYTRIHDWTKGVSTVAFRMELASTQKEVCSGKGAFALVDLNTGRNIPIPDWVIERYSINEEG